jgi:hypothetical protein
MTLQSRIILQDHRERRGRTEGGDGEEEDVGAFVVLH